MKDLKQANAVLGAAQKDLKALKGMRDIDIFSEEIFGFHAQQAIEKSLKAWLALLGKEYPLTHDISVLLELLRTSGEDVEMWWELVEYNAFAVRFRYESVDLSEESLDRESSITAIDRLFLKIKGLIEGTVESE